MKLSNKSKLTYNIIALLALGLLASTTVAYFHVKANLHDAVQNEQQIKATTTSNKLTSWLENNLSLVEAFADTLANSSTLIRGNELYEFYLNQVKKSRQFDYLAFALEEDGYYKVNDWEVPPSYDPRIRPWYQASKQAMIPTITPPHIGAEEGANTYIAATAPIIKSQKFMGVVVGEVTLGYVQKTILGMKLDYDGFAFLIDDKGTILVHPTELQVGKSIFELEDIASQDMQQLSEGRIVEGDGYLYSLANIANTKWRLIVAAEKTQLSDVLVNETISLLTHFLLIFLLIMMLFVFSNRKIFSPLIDWLERDTNTNLPNKKSFKQQATDSFLTRKSPGMLAIVSMDHFNYLTAAYSQNEVIQLLNQIKMRLESLLIHRSLLGQFSESRFIAYVNWEQDTNDRVMLRWLQSMADKLSAPYKVNQRQIHCTFSIGACCFPDQGVDIDDLIDNAFTVIANESRSGISSCGIFSPSMNQRLGGELIITSAMKSAIGNNEFYMQYQPQYDYEKRRIVSLEALIRWNSKELGRTVSPGEFIPIAEDSALIILLGDFVIDTVIKQIKHWNEIGLEFGKVSINISPKQLLKPGFTEDLLAKLARQGLSSRQIELEVTETSVLDNPDKGIAILKQLANAGFNLALDDFGTGYSSLEYLKLMPVDKLKIDRAFIRDLAVNNKDSAIAKIIVDMGSALGYQVLAEGVETKEQLDILASFGCNVIQGFYYSKPLHVADLESKLSNRESTCEIISY